MRLLIFTRYSFVNSRHAAELSLFISIRSTFGCISILHVEPAQSTSLFDCLSRPPSSCRAISNSCARHCQNRLIKVFAWNSKPTRLSSYKSWLKLVMSPSSEQSSKPVSTDQDSVQASSVSSPFPFIQTPSTHPSMAMSSPFGGPCLHQEGNAQHWSSCHPVEDHGQLYFNKVPLELNVIRNTGELIQ